LNADPLAGGWVTQADVFARGIWMQLASVTSMVTVPLTVVEMVTESAPMAVRMPL
jgi:hypothetical protein